MIRSTSFAALLAATTVAASAADLEMSPASEPVYSAAYSWTGFRVGVVVGGHAVDVNVAGVDAIDDSAVLGGVFAGYDFDSDGVVFGVEADIEASAFNSTVVCPNPAWTCNANINALGSLRGRLGVAVDSLLFYGTAGVAVADLAGSTSSGVATFPDEQLRVGWTAGAGMELAMDDNWFGRVEYRYSDFGTADMNFDVVYTDVSVTTHAIRAGVGYRF